MPQGAASARKILALRLYRIYAFGMSMDTQLVTDALELAGLPEIPHWLLNDAELAATSAIFDERVIVCGGKALVFTLGTAVGCALADPMAAALHFMEEPAGVLP